MEIKTEIIAVGSELLLGQIANTNAQFLSSQLAEHGISVYHHTVVGDNAQRLENVIKTAQTRSNFILFTGGLGPTKDDLTKETIAKVLSKNLVTDEKAMKNIENYFVRSNKVMTENNRKQAIVLEGSTVLPNDFGMAPGMALEVDGIHYMLLPGPPSELKPMFSQYGIPFLLNYYGKKDKIVSRVLRFFGIGESLLETEVEDLIDQQTNPTIAPLAGEGEVTLRLTASNPNENEAVKMLDALEKEILSRVGEYFYGYDKTTLFDELSSIHHKRQLTISAAESLTGGLFSQEMTAISGASSIFNGSVVCYTNEVKQNVLNVAESTLANFGAVSLQCAGELAENVRELTGSDIGISFTGVAGPSASEGKPVGTVYIGISLAGRKTEVHSLKLTGSRKGIRVKTARYGAHYLLNALEVK